MKKTLFLFHRDLRVQDNTSFIQACLNSDEIVCAFVFPPEQIDQKRNSYFSHPAVQFMCESLSELANDIPLHVFHGDYPVVLRDIYAKYPFHQLYQNQDVSVYAKKRDSVISSWCQKNNVTFCTHEDYGLFPLSDGLLPDGRPYTVLAQFYKKYLKALEVKKVATNKIQNKQLVQVKFPSAVPLQTIHTFYTRNPNIVQHGGRKAGLAIFQNIRKFVAYKDTRDYPSIKDGTTKLSAHLRFGTVSVREVYWACVGAFGTRDHPLIRELMFREFYMKIYALRPELQRGTAYQRALDERIPWVYDKTTFNSWANGMTGFPLVDAGMRQLLKEGWCHNRVRMLVASVATKYLLLDWRDCARYFYTKLVDADTFSNTAGWGWASSTGVDATLYFRAPFNPFIQSRKFDKDAAYIKEYIPELKDVATKDIHTWFDPTVRAKYANIKYPAPIIDHKEASARALKVFKQAAAASKQV